MPYRQTSAIQEYGSGIPPLAPNMYCVEDKNAADYGKCYNIISNKAIFFENNPVPCETDNTCIRATPYIYTIVTFDGRASGKQSIHTQTLIRANVYDWVRVFPLQLGDVHFGLYWLGETPSTGVNIYADLFTRIYRNRYFTPTRGTELWFILSKTFITDYLITVVAGASGQWFVGGQIRYYSYEVSPMLLLPLDYSEYLKYPELRRTVAYNANNAHPGWNASDIINIAKQLFPDRPWAVADDRANKLYLYGLTADDIISKILEIAGVYSPSIETLRDPFPAEIRQAFVSMYKRQPSVQPP